MAVAGRTPQQHPCPAQDSNPCPRSNHKTKITMSAIRTRYVLALMCFLGLANVYLLRVNLSVAIVEMAGSLPSKDNKSHEGECSYTDTEEDENGIIKKGELNWNSQDRGQILAAFYYGYIVGNVFGGRLSEIFGGVRVFGLGLLITSIVTLFTPLAARNSKIAVIFIRVLEGVTEGVAFPSLHTICTKWVPTKERGFTFSTIHTGAEFGTVIALPLAGVLSNSDFLGGWPACFYVFGCTGIIWYVFWWLLIFESPSVHPRINHLEREYILDNIEHKSKDQVKVPWVKLLTSVPLWASAITWLCGNWSFGFISSFLPTFMSNVLHFNIEMNGLLSSLPHIVNMAAQSVSGLISDLVLRRNLLGATKTRNAVHLLFQTISALAFVGVCLARCDRVTVIVCIVIGAGFQGSLVGTVAVALLDMAPDYAGTMMGLVNAFGNISSFAAPLVVGTLIGESNTLVQWQKCFYLTAGIAMLGGLLYALFGSSDLQSWAQVQNPGSVELSPVNGTTSSTLTTCTANVPAPNCSSQSFKQESRSNPTPNSNSHTHENDPIQ